MSNVRFKPSELRRKRSVKEILSAKNKTKKEKEGRVERSKMRHKQKKTT
jgi:hypothetical protein